MRFEWVPVEGRFEHAGRRFRKTEYVKDGKNATEQGGRRAYFEPGVEVDYIEYAEVGCLVRRRDKSGANEEEMHIGTRSMMVNTSYEVLHRQPNGLLTLKNYLILVPEDDVDIVRPSYKTEVIDDGRSSK